MPKNKKETVFLTYVAIDNMLPYSIQCTFLNFKELFYQLACLYACLTFSIFKFPE